MEERTPSTLWHYTDADGAFGIITSGVFRFGDSRFLNDRTEQTYAARLIKGALKENQNQPADAYGLLSATRGHWGTNPLPSRLYVCSFSEARDSLSQWERYGTRGSGYCIGFETASLDRYLGSSVRRVKMVYDTKTQRTALRRGLQHELERYTRELMHRAAEPFSATVSTCGSYICLALEEVALGLKNPRFADEVEWRYVVRQSDRLYADETPWDILFQSRHGYIKPYIELPRVAKHASRPLPVVSIICGPKLDMSLAGASLEHFLKHIGKLTVTVEQSKLKDVWR